MQPESVLTALQFRYQTVKVIRKIGLPLVHLLRVAIVSTISGVDPVRAVATAIGLVL